MLCKCSDSNTSVIEIEPCSGMPYYYFSFNSYSSVNDRYLGPVSKEAYAYMRLQKEGTPFIICEQCGNGIQNKM